MRKIFALDGHDFLEDNSFREEVIIMYQIGIDIGGTSIKIGLVDESLQIVRRSAIPFQCVGGEKVAAMIADEIKKLMKSGASDVRR